MSTANAPLRHEVRLGRELIRASEFSLKEVDKKPFATASIPLDRLVQADYYAPLQITRTRGDELIPIFTGTVDEARRGTSELLTISATGMTDFVEFGVAPFAHHRMPAIDLIYMVARTSGLSDGNIQIHVEPQLPDETFEVLVPVGGITIKSAVRLTPSVRLVPPNSGILERFQGDPGYDEPAGEMLGAHAWGVTYVTKRRVYEAEEAGRRDVAAALALLTAALRNGSTLDRKGRARDFRRSRSRALPMAGSAVIVSGLLTGRAWLRTVETVLIPVAIDGTEVPNLSVGAPTTSDVDLAALQSLWRAAIESGNPLLRLTALWEALEFYTSGIEPDITFSKSERRVIRSAALQGLPPVKQTRVTEVLQGLNTSPLLARIQKRAHLSGLALTQSDWDHLRRLRDARNDAVHGRQNGEVTREDLAYGVSIVSRLLLQSSSPGKQGAAPPGSPRHQEPGA